MTGLYTGPESYNAPFPSITADYIGRPDNPVSASQ